MARRENGVIGPCYGRGRPCGAAAKGPPAARVRPRSRRSSLQAHPESPATCSRNPPRPSTIGMQPARIASAAVRAEDSRQRGMVIEEHVPPEEMGTGRPARRMERRPAGGRRQTAPVEASRGQPTNSQSTIGARRASSE